jgi:RNA polymerase sigma-B factor
MPANTEIQNELLAKYHEEGDLQARAELVERLMPLVRHIARRYAHRGEPLDDLVQVGAIGLMKAVDRFDPERGARLSTFAAPNIAGEIKRHFRDRGWTVRPPREVQELAGKITQTVDKLTGRLGRSPTASELAAELKVTDEEILEAMQGAQSYSAVSFEEPAGEGRTALDLLGDDDDGFDQIERHMLVGSTLGALGERERRIIRLRFFHGLTQREIAEQVGVSQMHVSRLIRRSLERMRQTIEEQDAAALAS